MRAERTPSKYTHIFTQEEVQHFCALVCNCTSVIIQDLPDSTTQQNVIQYLAQNKLKAQVNQFILVPPNKLALNFTSSQAAYRYYLNHNLSQNFGKSLLNTYLHINFDPKYLNKFLLIGVYKKNQQKIFSIAKRFGIIKISFINKDPKEFTFMAILSIADARVFTKENYDSLKENLQQFGIITKICKQSNIMPKMEVCLNNFLNTQGLYKKSQVFIIVWNIIAALKLSFEGAPFVSIQSKQKDTNWQIGCPHNKVYAKIICPNDIETKEIFSKLAQYAQKNSKARVILNKKENTNSYANLFTKDLKSPPNISDYQFKNILLKEYRKVTPQIANLTLLKTERDRVYHGKLYFENELAGRKFLAYYIQYKENLKLYYNKPNKWGFQMYVDKQTLYEFGEFKRRLDDKPKKQIVQFRQKIRSMLIPQSFPHFGGHLPKLNQLHPFHEFHNQKNPEVCELKPEDHKNQLMNISQNK